MRRTISVIVGAVALVATLLWAPPVHAATPTFGGMTLVNSSDFGGEPGVDVDSTGYIYENAPSGGGASWVYRSGDDGTTWTRTPGPVLPSGGFDSNGAVDSCNTYYMTDLYIASAGIHWTKDHGQTWTSQPLTLASAPGDRQWVETGPGCGTLYESWENLGTGIWMAKSTDGGLTWPVQQQIGPSTDIIGNLAVDKSGTKTNGTVYQAYALGGMHVITSADGGATWKDRTVYTAPRNVSLADSFPVVTVDRGGNVYAVWEQSTSTTTGTKRNKKTTVTFDIYYASSIDQGATWSQPHLVQSGATGSNVFPWAVGGQAGHLDIVWYRSESGNGDPNNNTGPWYVDFAQSLTATSGTGFTTVRATPVSVHNDVICTSGTNCSGSTRDLLDFFEVALKPNGLAVISFADDTMNFAAGTGNGDPRNAFIKQTGGDPA